MSVDVIALRETESSPSATAGGVSFLERPKYLRAALYVDGFNLYHALDNLGQPHLKWLDLAALANRIAPRRTERMIKVRYFTALKPGQPEKNKRHREYIAALKFFNVKIDKGHFITDQVDCRKCLHVWDKPQEKETDVNIALRILDDAYQNVFDVAYMLTADSDQGATARMLKFRFPKLRLVSVVPPGMEASKAIMSHTEYRLKLPVEYIEDCLLPGMMLAGAAQKQSLVFKRPTQYDPPSGWLPPSERRKRAKA